MESLSRIKTLAILSQMRWISCEPDSISRLSAPIDPSNLNECAPQLGVRERKTIALLRIPCFSALRREAALPATLLGPVERLALTRFACSFRSEIGRLIRKESCVCSASDRFCWI